MGDSDRVTGDYSGRPIERPTKEEVAAAMARSGSLDSAIGTDLPGGGHAIYGADKKWYHLHIVDGRQVWDRPVDWSKIPDEPAR